jgi:hypothetical protein
MEQAVRTRQATTGVVLVVALGTLPSAAALSDRALAAEFTVTATMTPAKIRLGEEAVLSGTVAPVRTGTQVAIQRKKPSGWVTVAHRSMDDEGVYSFAITPSKVGEYLYRARMPKVGRIASDTSPRRRLVVREHLTVVFTIPAGTGASSFNSSDDPVVAQVGDTLRLVNEDSEGHRLHTNGEPFPHPPEEVPPGQSADYLLESAFTGALDCHTHGQDSLFWITVTGPTA